MAKDLKRRIVAEFSAKNRAKGVMSGFRRDMDSTGRALRRMAMGALAVAGIGGLGYMLKKTMESIDAVAKMSDELQISTEALTGLEHAAKISGTSIETLHKGMGIFVRRMGEAKFGVGEGVRGLKMLGLEADQIIKMGTEKSFMLIAQRISEAGTAAEQAGIAYNFFGRQGTQLLNMFQQGEAGIKAMREEAERLGLTFSRFDAAQVEAANDALTRARAVLTGLIRQATIELAPYIEVLADKFVDVATAGEGLGANVINVFESMSMGAIRFGGLIQTIPSYWKGVEAGARETLAAIYDIAAAVTNLDVLFKKLKRPGWEKTYKELAQEQRQIAADLKEEGGRQLAVSYGQENAIMQFYDGLQKKAAGRRKELEDKARQQSGGVDIGLGVEPLEAGAMLEHYDKLMAKGGTYQEMQERMARQRIETDIEASRQRYAAEDAAARDIEKVWTEMWLREEEAAYHAWRAPMKEKEEQIDKAAERRIRINEDIALSMAQSWSSAIDQMMFEGKKFWDAMEDMARSLTRMIANILIYRGIALPIARGIMPTEKAQYGGVFTRPTLVQAGEVPEAFVPLRSGKIPVEMRGGAAGEGRMLEMHIHYHGQEKPKITRAEEYLLSNRRIIDVTLQALQTDANYRRGIAQVK